MGEKRLSTTEERSFLGGSPSIPVSPGPSWIAFFPSPVPHLSHKGTRAEGYSPTLPPVHIARYAQICLTLALSQALRVSTWLFVSSAGSSGEGSGQLVQEASAR